MANTTYRFRSSLTGWLFLATTCGLAVACGDDDDNPGGSGGSAGHGGQLTGGKASSGGGGGSAAKGGSSGNAGGATNGGAATGGATSATSGGAATNGGATAGGSASGGSMPGHGGRGGAGEGGEAGSTGGAGGSGGQAQAGEGGEGGERVIFTTVEMTTIHTLSPLPALPPDPTNAKADDAAAATLGQKFFFDKRYSGALTLASDLGAVGESGKIACASCHASDYFGDNHSTGPVAIGADKLTRNALSLVNSSFYQWTNWGGRFSAPWQLPIAVAESAKNMHSSRLAVAHLVWDKYKSEYEAVFSAIPVDISTLPATGGGSDAAFTGLTDPQKTAVNQVLANFGKALEAYQRKLVSRDAPFDRFVAGNASAISQSAQRGLQVFIGKGRCTSCHSGSHFSDDSFHNLGLPDAAATPDAGRFADVPLLIASTNPFNAVGPFSDDKNTGREANLTNPMPDSAKGQFRTPDLRGASLTAPYMHAGNLATLEAVVDFYDQGGGPAPIPVGTKDSLLAPLGLTANEKHDLVEFLKTLNGEAIPASLRIDTSNP